MALQGHWIAEPLQSNGKLDLFALITKQEGQSKKRGGCSEEEGRSA
jgi:hypothetical protein